MIATISLALAMGFAFGWLLQYGRVANCTVVVDQFRLRDFAMMKVMLTAIVVGGAGVLVLVDLGDAKYYIKDANLLAVAVGAALFGASLPVLGFCPGTSIAALGAGSLHALIGLVGMVFGAILYAFSFDWLKTHVLTVAAFGKARLPELTGAPDFVWLLALALLAGVAFYFVEKRPARI